MISTLARRGPDGEGIKRWDGVVFGHRRLAIFDLSQAGHQPMVSPDGAVGVVFNGAIYNYRELRSELLSRGYVFTSQTDTEVLVHGYREWGIDALVRQLRGMFAFAVWDDRSSRLYLVRDRLGVKPLAFAIRDSAIAFASTVRALSVAGYGDGLDAASIDEFLESGFLSDDRCIYRGLEKLPAGSILEWSSGRRSLRQYWTFPLRPTMASISFGEAVEETRRLLLEAVKFRLHADVEVGALLSGGIDSGLVCWAVRKLGGELRTYTVGTPGDAWDETIAATETARALGLAHTVVALSEEDMPEVDDLVSAYAEPFGSASALGMLAVCRAISRSSHAKVLLTGDGGDDVFLGYPRHRNLWIASRLSSRLPERAKTWWRRSRQSIPRVGALRRAAALMEYATDGLNGVLEHATKIERDETARLRGARLEALHREVTREPHASGQDVLSDFLGYEFRTRFVGEYMTKVDGATMYYGIEGRSPFLDQYIWEFASSIPFDVRLHHGRLKAILRHLAREEIAPSVARRPKRGFGIPVQRWILHRWRPWVEELLSESLLEKDGWLRPGVAIGRLSDAAKRGIAPAQLWYAIVLESWLRQERGLRGSSATCDAPLVFQPSA
jgi:asparagine synthase (glutamine-hydrolysing)